MALDIFARLSGTVKNFFHFGGPNRALIRSQGAEVLESMDATGTSFTIHRGADPVDDNDFATKQYVDGVASPNAVKSIRYTVGTTTLSSNGDMPADAIVMRASIKIVTPYDPGTTITVGWGALPSALIQDTDNTPTAPADTFFLVDQDTYTTIANEPVLTTIAGGPAAGECIVTVYYSNPVP